MSQQAFHQGWLDRVEEWFIKSKARQLMNKAGFSVSDIEDIEQDLRLDVLERLPGFDPTKSNRRTFIAMVVNCRAATILKRRHAEKRNGGDWLRSLDVLVPGEDDDEVAFHETLEGDVRRPIERTAEERCDLVADVHQVVASLPDDLRPWCAILAEQNISEASREFGVPRIRIYQIKARIRAAFERAGLEGYLQKK